MLRHKQVLVLGGGVAGVLAAHKSIRDEGIVEVLVVEARDELGGRMHSTTFGQHGVGSGGGSGPFTVELGANWIQGTREGDGPVNPILVLAEKYGVRAVESDYYSSISASRRPSVFFFWRWGGSSTTRSPLTYPLIMNFL
jgi:polyamine oxidase